MNGLSGICISEWRNYSTKKIEAWFNRNMCFGGTIQQRVGGMA